jgi:hypothetical protein
VTAEHCADQAIFLKRFKADDTRQSFSIGVFGETSTQTKRDVVLEEKVS